MHRVVLLAGVALSVLALACSGPSTECVTDADCFSGEVCTSEMVCGSAGVSNSNNGTNRRDAGHASGDAAETNSDIDSGPVVMRDAGSCVVDRFTFQCVDDEHESNNTWIDGHRITPETVGCNPDWVAFETTLSARMCPLDAEDWYYLNFVSCSDASWILEFQLEVEDPCASSHVVFEPLSFGCDEAGVQCTQVDGKPTIRMQVSPTLRNLQAFYFSVDIGEREDVTFDYQIHVSARR